MVNFDSSRMLLLALVAGLLSCLSGQAQTRPGTAVITTDGSMSMASASALNTAPAVSRTALKLNLPPAPETTASFYDGSHKDLHQSLDWMRETNAIAPTYWTLYTEARILLQLADYAAARTTAEQAYKLALKSMPASQEYVMLSAAVVAKSHELAKR